MPASQPAATYRLLAPRLARRGRRPRSASRAASNATRDEERSADQAELEQHLVVGLLRDEVPSLAGK